MHGTPSPVCTLPFGLCVGPRENDGTCNYLFREKLRPIKVENVREPLSRQGRETCFLNSEMPKNILACPSINKSNGGHGGTEN